MWSLYWASSTPNRSSAHGLLLSNEWTGKTSKSPTETLHSRTLKIHKIPFYHINLYLAKISLIWCIGSIRIWIFPPSGTCSILKSYLRTPYLWFSSFRWKDRIDWVSASWLSSTSREKLQLNRNELPFSVKWIQNRKQSWRLQWCQCS